MTKMTVAAALCALAMPFAAFAQAPSGFTGSASAQPQGFSLTTLKSIEEVRKNSYDEQLVVLRGRFTRQVTHDKYEFTDEKGNSVIFETITNKWTEELARAVTMSCGGSVSVSLYPMHGAQMKQYGVRGIVTRSQQLGTAIRTVRTAQNPERHFLEFTEGYKLFKGKIADVLRETREGFNFGRVLLEGIGECKGRSAAVEFQNENLTAEVDGKIVATVPDLICLVDTETFAPVTTDALKYGKRVLVVGLRCFELWRCPAGLELVGPRYFGVDTDYIPLEERCKEVCPHV